MYDGINKTAEMLLDLFSGKNQNDASKRLPLRMVTRGGGQTDGRWNVPAVWSNRENDYNALEWMRDLFLRLNVVMQPSLQFETSRAFIEMFVSKNQKVGEVIKNNIKGIVFEQAENALPSATVCTVVDSESKQELLTYYLLDNNTVTTVADAPNRVQPYRLTVAEIDQSKSTDQRAVAENALLYKDFEHFIAITIDKNHNFYPNLQIGDSVTIVPKVMEMTKGMPPLTDKELATIVIPSVYTGRQVSSESTISKLFFGKFRVEYTDFIQQNYRRQK
ncbi:MAG: hypothetical protein FWD76_02780 [Firmicutes bacterium]|nr:hypothetical protein [Bacillota bacterium]